MVNLPWLEDAVRALCEEYHKRISGLEEQKYDLEYAVKRKDFEVRFQNLDSSPS